MEITVYKSVDSNHCIFPMANTHTVGGLIKTTASIDDNLEPVVVNDYITGFIVPGGTVYNMRQLLDDGYATISPIVP